MRNKKGFTLIELLAVIIILAVIALIATPIVLNVIDNARKSANKDSAYGLLDSAKLYYMESLLDENKSLSGNLIDKINISGNKPSSGIIYINSNGEIALAVVYDKTCYIKNYSDTDLTESDDIENCKVSIVYKDNILNGADPELDESMIPIVINQDGSVSKADTRLDWYDYTEKRWANVVLVSDESRSKYINAKAGTPIEVEDIKAYYVWIPRYKYQIFTDVNNLETVGNITDVSTYNNKAQIINVVFENNTSEKSTGTTKDSWLTHPAFTFGDKELNGIWVGKFETTGTESVPTVLPYTSENIQQSLISQNVSTQFATSQKINYGITSLEASMLKNSEWGAVAYLTASIYGQGTEEVMINNSEYFYTGCAATVAPTATSGGYTSQTGGSEGSYAGCENEWYTTNGQKASTTGTMYGVYDMSGGALEYVMGVMEDSLGSGVALSGRNNNYNSGFTGNLGCPICEASSGNDSSITSITGVSFPESKYYDIYTYDTSSTVYANRGHLGDATYELDEFTNWKDPDESTRYHSGWNKDYALFVNASYPWFVRGGAWYDGASAGVFAFIDTRGSAHSGISFRSVLR